MRTCHPSPPANQGVTTMLAYGGGPDTI